MADRKQVHIKNRKARHEYALEGSFTAGIVLTGAEVKSVRDARASIGEAYCLFDNDRLIIRGMHISEFKQAGYAEQHPDRDRFLLLKKTELKKLKNKVKDVGYTIVPLELFVSETGYIKLVIAPGKGKKLYDKRQDLKKKDMSREIDRF